LIRYALRWHCGPSDSAFGKAPRGFGQDLVITASQNHVHV